MLKHGQRDLLCFHLVLYYSVNSTRRSGVSRVLFQGKRDYVSISMSCFLMEAQMTDCKLKINFNTGDVRIDTVL